MNENDPIDQLFAVILKLSPKFSAAVLKQAEAEVRAKFGGERHYIAKRKKHPSESQKAEIFKDGVSSMTTEEVCEKHQITRGTLYRHLKRG